MTRIAKALLASLTLLAGALTGAASYGAEPAVVIPPPALDEAPAAGLQKAVVAGGCFWGIQGVYQHTVGVVSAVSGYSGGTKESADYGQVSAHRTQHAESVEITFDPQKITYGKLLQILFSVAHNPTELDRQGPDVGHQYRSDIFYVNDEQKKIAEAYIGQLDAAKVFSRPIVTRVDALQAFYPAEAYHQDYATLHPMQPYIAINDLPKIENLKRIFPEVYRAQPVLVAAAIKK
jgi:peptide-methionine (S)-S-oxide reductase